ncbi:MAG: 4Fe-4S dicluster domain-containing protein [Desulfobacterales bacterium]|nr:4Fe-4S dicluster domain-containing protein [Desulfobacterales bacterium]
MKKYAMVIDTKTCVGCGDCVIACKTENRVPEGLHRDWIVEDVSGKFPNLNMEIRSERCNHCSNPPCVTYCPTGASYINRGTNIVLVNKSKCTGCKACIAACPYDARFIMPEGYVGKCTFCEHRVKKGLSPACASVCPTQSIDFGDVNESMSNVSKLLRKRKYKTLIPEAGTRPNVYYLI